MSRAGPVRAAAQQTVAQLVPLASALGSITSKSGDAALSALAAGYRDLIGVYQRLSLPAKQSAARALVRQVAVSRRNLRHIAAAAGVPRCVPR